MEFIAAITVIPVPRVHAARWSDNKKKFSEFVIDYIPGESLDKAWEKLTHDQRVATCHQLRGYLSQLRELKGKRIEAPNGARVTIGLRFPCQCGPFDTEKEFHDFLVEKDTEKLPPYFKRYTREALRDDHDLHFAHGDFSPRNIMVDETGHVVSVLDWDRAGWYPEYWDHNRIFSENPGIRDYFPYIHYILPFNYREEVLAIGYLLRLTGNA